MRCPSCGHDDDRVIDSRAVREGRAVRRRRECLRCGERYTTYEGWETRPVLVVKRDGRRVAYDRAKITTGIAKACEKRPVSLEQIEILVDSIEQDLARSGRREVPTGDLGQKVLERLHEVDDVAYVRFASVYRSFQDVHEFLELLQSLQQERENDR
ncbi:transcriptional repressor NrdR [bacterium]|nr:transcriptional repressor NrdR [bacterium]